MLSSIWAKISGALAVVGGILLLMLKGEKSKRKAAELEAKTEKSNRELLEKKEEIISNIDEERESWQETQSENAIYQAERLKEIENEKDNLSDSDFTASITKLFNKDNRKDKAS